MEFPWIGRSIPNLLIAKSISTIGIDTFRALSRGIRIRARFALSLALMIGFLFLASGRGQARNGAPPTTATLSANFFDFGNNIVNNTLTQTVATLTNTGSNTLSMNPRIAGSKGYVIVQEQSCGSSLAPAASCPIVVSFTPTSSPALISSAAAKENATLHLNFANVAPATPQIISITGASAAMLPGGVTPTDNPQVALYTMTLPYPGSMKINFGTTTNYGLATWSQSTDVAGGQLSILVAGMRTRTKYHMAATVELSNGVTFTDVDHVFTTGGTAANVNLAMTATTAAGMTPQPGLEMLNTIGALVVTDLSGNVLWTYSNPGSLSLNFIQGVKMLPNGNILMAIGANSSSPLQGMSPGAVIEIREVNLAGDTVRSISIADLNSRLATATCSECNVTLQTFHHDITPLPNGHWLVLANTIMNLSPTTTPALTAKPPQAVLGDVIVDLDQNLEPVWTWNEFNHLDPNHQPYYFPDWTHTNAVVYSPDDGNILVSMRHQNWIVKVDYANGTGSGKVLWRLGEGGDFKLIGGTDPNDWEYAQHGPTFASDNTTGVFSLAVMDNGDDRQLAAGVSCGAAGAPPCLYSTTPVFRIDEVGRTATLTFHQISAPSQYSQWGGNAEQLVNGNIEYDLCGAPTGSYVYEVTQEANPQTVWSLTVSNSNFYRAFRIPSLYPGVQW